MAMKPAGKAILIFLIVGLILGGLYFLSGGDSPKKSVETKNYNFNDNSTGDVEDLDITIKVGVVDWPGYLGGQLYNGGFAPSEESNFYKNFGFKVEFITINDFDASRKAFQNGELDLLWVTVDAFPTESSSLDDVALLFVADKSRGGDVMVANSKVRSLNDIKGKTVAWAVGTPSNTFGLWALETAQLTINDITLIKTASAPEAAQIFQSGDADVAVVWSPDDIVCLEKVSGSKILTSTKQAGEIIVDGFLVKKSNYSQHKEIFDNLVKGWLTGNATLNSDPKAKQLGIEILATNTEFDAGFWKQTIDNVRFLTYGDNLNFFGLTSGYSGITGKELYNKMGKKYAALGLASYSLAPWNSVSIDDALKNISLNGAQHNAEGVYKFESKSKEELVDKPVISVTTMRINFSTASYQLSDADKYELSKEFGDILRTTPGVRVRLVGHTDNVGNFNSNMLLSEKRANAVAQFFIERYGFDRNRFVVVGKGSTEPVGDNSTDQGRYLNRRTDLELINE